MGVLAHSESVRRRCGGYRRRLLQVWRRVVGRLHYPVWGTTFSRVWSETPLNTDVQVFRLNQKVTRVPTVSHVRSLTLVKEGDTRQTALTHSMHQRPIVGPLTAPTRVFRSDWQGNDKQMKKGKTRLWVERSCLWSYSLTLKSRPSEALILDHE